MNDKVSDGARQQTTNHEITAVFFDFGGVISTSPFDAFNTYERSLGMPVDTIRTINANNSNNNAWARFERSEVDDDGFAELFEAEAKDFGFEISGHAVLRLIAGDIRPQMIEAVRRVKSAGLLTACLTNNFRTKATTLGADGATGTSVSEKGDSDKSSPARALAEAIEMFDHVIESSTLGVRKPEPLFYQRALEMTGVEAAAVVFLDDLGMNLKPAKAIGMTTIKVIDPDVAIAELEQVVGLVLRKPSTR